MVHACVRVCVLLACMWLSVHLRLYLFMPPPYDVFTYRRTFAPFPLTPYVNERLRAEPRMCSHCSASWEPKAGRKPAIEKPFELFKIQPGFRFDKPASFSRSLTRGAVISALGQHLFLCRRRSLGLTWNEPILFLAEMCGTLLFAVKFNLNDGTTSRSKKKKGKGKKYKYICLWVTPTAVHTLWFASHVRWHRQPWQWGEAIWSPSGRTGGRDGSTGGRCGQIGF